LVLAAVAFLMVYVPMAVEARRAAHNERAQWARGGVEAAGDVYRVMRIAYPAAFLLMIAEGAWRGTRFGPLAVAGAMVFLAGKALKWSAIVSLGRAWTFRVITVPGAQLVTGGPYRLFRHPNYIGVIGELAGAALATGAVVSGPAATAAFGLLMWKRVGVEERALDASRSSAASYPRIHM
jgi:methyltransferase